MPPRTARVQRKAPVALTSRCARQSSSVVRASGAPAAIPALLTSTSTWSSSKNASTAASSVTSRWSWPGARTSSPENRSATAFPIPFAPPVTTTMRVTRRAPSGRACPTGFSAARLRTRPRARNGEPVLRHADDRALDDVRMADETVLDLGRRDPDATDLDQVVDSAPVPEEPVVVALEEVARADAVAVEGALRLLGVVPVEEGGRVAADEQL